MKFNHEKEYEGEMESVMYGRDIDMVPLFKDSLVVQLTTKNSTLYYKTMMTFNLLKTNLKAQIKSFLIHPANFLMNIAKTPIYENNTNYEQ